MFKNLLSLQDAGGTFDIITIIDTTLENESLIGKMIIVHADGHADGEVDTGLRELITSTIKAVKWEKPTTLSVTDGTGGTGSLISHRPLCLAVVISANLWYRC